MPLVVAVTMKRHAVGKPVASPELLGKDGVDFAAVFLAEGPATGAPLTRWPREQLAPRARDQRVVLSSPRPVHEVAVKWTGRSLYFAMALEPRAGMRR